MSNPAQSALPYLRKRLFQDEANHVVVLLKLNLALMLSITFAMFVVLQFVYGFGFGPLGTTFLIVHLLAWGLVWLLRRGHIQWVSHATLLLLGAGAFVGHLGSEDGIQVFAAALMWIVMLTGLLMPPRLIIAYTGLVTALLGWGVYTYIGAINGDFLAFSLFLFGLFLTAGVIIAIASATIHDALDRAHRSEQSLRDQNRELQNQISERQRLEIVVREREEALRLALQGGNLNAWRWDFASNAIWMVNNWVSPPQTIENMPFDQWLDTIHPDDRMTVREALLQIKAKELTIEAPLQFHAALWDHYVLAFFYGELQGGAVGEPTGISGVIQEVSWLETLSAQQIELGMLKSKQEFLTEFIGNLSHDLKTPIAVMNTSLYLLEMPSTPDRQHEHILRLKAQTDRLQKLVDDVLTISRLEYAPMLKLEDIPVNDLLNEVTTQLRPTAEQRQLNLAVELDVTDPKLKADRKDILRALLNLVENAINYTPNGGTVNLRCKSAGQRVQIEVEDTGIGIQPDELPKIFDRFYRSAEAREFSRTGTGLGLAIVKKIAETHGGDVKAESKPGKGTRMNLELPAASAIMH